MTERELTPIEREAAAILEADIRARLGDGPVTASALKAALVESVESLAAPLDTSEIIIERDPHDPRRVNFFVPLGWFAAGLIQRRAEP
jgi:hypothetical protein